MLPLMGQDVEVSYGLPRLPIEISWSSSRGASIALKTPELITPIGTFSARLTLWESARRFPDTKVLVVVIGNQSYVYDLHGKRFILELPNNLKGKATIETDDGNIYLRIPNPEVLGPPSRVGPDALDTSATIKRGKFTLQARQYFSFMTESANEVSGDLSIDLITVNANRVLPLGAVSLERVTELPAPVIPSLGEALRDIFQGNGRRPDWSRSAAVTVVGHSYGIQLGPKGPFAVLQITSITPDYQYGRHEITFHYLFQQDGSLRFK
jgi:hypothetical protein